MQQYDFHKASIQTKDDGTIKIDNPNGFTVHQLPDLIRTLQTINARHQSGEAKKLIEGLRRDLEGNAKKAELRSLDGGPKGAA